MMQIGIVRVLVAHRFVPMPMRVRLGHRPIVMVPVMLVMHVSVLVLQSFVLVLVVVPLGEVQI